MDHAQAHSHPAALPGAIYAPRQPQNTALFRVMQAHLASFLEQWQGAADGRSLPRHVTLKLQEYVTCGIPQHGFLDGFHVRDKQAASAECWRPAPARRR